MSVSNISYQTINIRGVDIFYREAGAKTAPTLLLLHGFPSSSHMFRDLMPQLAGKYHVLALDYPGFGYSGEPPLSQFDYSFAALADLLDAFAQNIGLQDYVLYMQDYGGPVGLRLAVKHPERIRGLIIQNATIHAEGWNPETTKPFGPFWKTRSTETEAPLRGFLKAETTQWQYSHGEPHPQLLSPDAWTHDQRRLDQPGNDAVQLQYLWNYQDNLSQYPVWQNYLLEKQPPLLIVWGKNDPFFTMDGVAALQTLVPAATVEIYDAGHFALESHGKQIAEAIGKFMTQNLKSFLQTN